MRRRVFQQFEFVAKDYTASFTLNHLGYMGDFLQIDIADYKDETVVMHKLPIPSGVWTNPQYQYMNWDVDIDLQHNTWKLKIKDSIIDDIHKRNFSFECTELGIKAEFVIKREKYLFAGYYIVTNAVDRDYSWWHQDRNFGVQATGILTIKGKEKSFNKVNHGRFNYQHLAGNAEYKSGQITAVINGFNRKMNQINLFTTTGLSDSYRKNRASLDAFFLDDARSLMEPMNINFDRKDLMKPWTVETNNIELFTKKMAKLTFTPWGASQKKQNYFVVKTDFNRVAGFFEGWIVDEEGTKHELKRVQGYMTLNYVQG